MPPGRSSATRGGGAPVRRSRFAAALHLSPGTVRNHVSSVLSKLGLAIRQQATIHARERGWV
ncbi:LuxR C-terminal-related transcriptional regulator [Microbacterium sp. BWR-S6Y]|uniref:response regulator transcription factor n=1 Tax=Microbacterium sp. BWR-S6Y TaxID=3232073 RepID=UPI0035282682